MADRSHLLFPERGALLCVAFAILSACQTTTPDEPATKAATASSQSALEGAHETLGFVQAACGGCHAVEANSLSPNPSSPSFAEIANRPWLTRESLADWLRDAHNYPEEMDFDLSGDQSALIADYMITLRSADFNPPI